MNPLIWSGDVKITCARSPIIPAGTGAPFCGPSSLIWQQPAALRDFGPAYDRCGSKPAEMIGAI
jgi:hypothetical protein